MNRNSTDDSVGSFSAAIAQALPSPASRSGVTGIPPPQKLLGGALPPSPGGRMMYRQHGGPSPSGRYVSDSNVFFGGGYFNLYVFLLSEFPKLSISWIPSKLLCSSSKQMTKMMMRKANPLPQM